MKIVKVWFDDDNFYLQTNTGHIIGNPIAWFKRLKNASASQRENFELGSFLGRVYIGKK